MSTTPSVAMSPQPSRFLDRLRTSLLMRGLKPEVTEAWVGWARTFIRFHQLRHPERMGEAEIGAFLTHLAGERGASLPQQAQARQALRWLYQQFRDAPSGNGIRYPYRPATARA